MSKIILQTKELTKHFNDAESVIKVLNKIDFEVRAGEKIAIIGSSGSGKSTLLQCLGGLDKPTKGKVLIQERDFEGLSDSAQAHIRNQSLGFVFQFHHLLPEFSALENVLMPLRLTKNKPFSEDDAINLLSGLGLEHRLTHTPDALSGGERQRVAIARAMISRPACLLADEPTGNLDNETALLVFNKLLELVELYQVSLVLVTHDLMLAKKMDRVLTLRGGQLFEE